MSGESGGGPQAPQPTVDPPAHVLGDFGLQLTELLGGQAVQRADIHMPEVFSLTDQPRPGAGRLPALQLLLQLPLCRLGLLGHSALGLHPSA